MDLASLNKAVVKRFNREFMEKADMKVLPEIVADDFINHTAAKMVSKDLAGLIRFIEILHGGFSEIKVDIHEMIAEGDLVATRKTIHAMHTGMIFGHAPTGKSVTFCVMDFVRLRNGKYIAHWGQNNVMEVIGQL